MTSKSNKERIIFQIFLASMIWPSLERTYQSMCFWPKETSSDFILLGIYLIHTFYDIYIQRTTDRIIFLASWQSIYAAMLIGVRSNTVHTLLHLSKFFNIMQKMWIYGLNVWPLCEKLLVKECESVFFFFFLYYITSCICMKFCLKLERIAKKLKWLSWDKLSQLSVSTANVLGWLYFIFVLVYWQTTLSF